MYGADRDYSNKNSLYRIGRLSVHGKNSPRRVDKFSLMATGTLQAGR